jgi:hypothetical protein
MVMKRNEEVGTGIWDVNMSSKDLLRSLLDASCLGELTEKSRSNQDQAWAEEALTRLYVELWHVAFGMYVPHVH